MNDVYHLVPRNLTGSVLQPLNTLKKSIPELYTAHVKKYTGREMLLQRNIPYLDCLWNDVLHFSPVDPVQIRDGFIKAGYSWKPMQWFKANPKELGFYEENTVIYYSRPKAKGDFTTKEEDFKVFSTEEVGTICDLPATTAQYYKEAIERGEKPFVFLYIAHILYHGSINIADIEIIEV